MSEYIVSCCSAADLSVELRKEYDIHVLPFRFTIGSDAYEDDLFSSIDAGTFYSRMMDGEITATTQNNVLRYTEYFEPFLKEGLDILHITLPSAITGTIGSATIAANDLMEKYPGRKISILDSFSASLGYGLLMIEIAELKRQGLSLDEITEAAAELRYHIHHWFFATDLKYYIRGGRLSKTAGFVASALNICPFGIMNANGELDILEKVRTRKKVLKTMIQKMEEYADGGLDYDGYAAVVSSAGDDDINDLTAMIEEHFPNVKKPILTGVIGPTIGSHTGPGTSALFFNGVSRKVLTKDKEN